MIKALDLHALKNLPDAFPQPQGLEWINRGRNTRLKRKSVEMLMRTLFRGIRTASVNRLHEEAGLRVIFRSDEDRRSFAKLFESALAECHARSGIAETPAP